jgi:hypothetical protein
MRSAVLRSSADLQICRIRCQHGSSWTVSDILRFVETIDAWLGRTLASGCVGEVPPHGAAVLSVAREHRVDVLFAHLILRARARSELFSRDSLGAIVRLAVARELAAARDVTRLFESADAAGLELLLLKGTALAYMYYPEPYLRPRNDIDLFVRQADIRRCEAVLSTLGFARAQEADAEWWTAQRHYSKTTPAGAVHVDLHWRVVNPQVFAGVLAFDDVWPRSVSVTPLGSLARTLSPPDTLLLACVHRVAHHQDRVNLLWLWDIHLIASALSAADWAQFLVTAASSRVQGICARGLALAHECFLTAIPQDVRQALGAAREEPAGSFLGSGLRTVDVVRADLAALTNWRSKVALIREHVCPPIAYMRTKYDRCPPILLPLAYLHRIVRGAPRWFER